MVRFLLVPVFLEPDKDRSVPYNYDKERYKSPDIIDCAKDGGGGGGGSLADEAGTYRIGWSASYFLHLLGVEPGFDIP